MLAAKQENTNQMLVKYEHLPEDTDFSEEIMVKSGQEVNEIKTYDFWGDGDMLARQ